MALIALLGACATKPPAPPEPEPQVVAPQPAPEPTPPPQPAPKEPEISLEELKALHERVLALRKDAFDLGLRESMAADFAAADAKYVSGKAALDKDDRPAAKADLSAAEPLFAELVAKGAAMVAEARKADAAAARGRALNASAESLSPGALASADAAVVTADGLLASGDRKAAIAAYGLAITAYDAVEKRSRAVTVRDKVDSLSFGPMDSGNYELAGQKLELVDGLVPKDPATAQDAAAEALLRYNLVLSKGWELSAGGKREVANKYKADSEELKAQVAVRQAYAEAADAWRLAEAAYSAGKHEDSAPLFDRAEELFKAVYETTAQKKAAAEAALKDAGAMAEQSAAVAAQGDQMLGVGEDGGK